MKPNPLAAFLIGLLFTFLIPFAILNLPALADVTTLDVLAYTVGFVTLTSSALYALALTHADQSARGVGELKAQLVSPIHSDITLLAQALRDASNILIYTVDRETVYKRLQHYATQAKHRVDLMYFGDKPPTGYSKSETKETYVSELDATIRAHKKNFRRIILYTPENRGWIRSLIEAHRDNDRFCLSIITNPNGLALVSAQVIDDDVAILMNLDKSIVPNRPRDLVFESKRIAAIADAYYNEMFSKAVPIVVNGQIAAQGFERYFVTNPPPGT